MATNDILSKLMKEKRELTIRANQDEMEIQTALEAYARKSCLDLCQHVYNTFPREVRDMIYGYIIGCEDATRKLGADCNTVWPVHYLDWDSKHRLSPRTFFFAPKHCRHAGYVGTDMIREIGERYYHCTTFQFGDNTKLIEKFKCQVHWGFPFSPVSFIMNLGVHICCALGELKAPDGISGELLDDELWKINDLERRWTNPKVYIGITETALAIMKPQQVLLHLESLFGFRAGTTITVGLGVPQYAHIYDLKRHKSFCNKVVPLIFPTIQRLKDAGIHIRCRFNMYPTCTNTGVCTMFTSVWNPASAEELSEEYRKVSLSHVVD